MKRVKGLFTVLFVALFVFGCTMFSSNNVAQAAKADDKMEVIENNENRCTWLCVNEHFIYKKKEIGVSTNYYVIPKKDSKLTISAPENAKMTKVLINGKKVKVANTYTQSQFVRNEVSYEEVIDGVKYVTYRQDSTIDIYHTYSKKPTSNNVTVLNYFGHYEDERFVVEETVRENLVNNKKQYSVTGNNVLNGKRYPLVMVYNNGLDESLPNYTIEGLKMYDGDVTIKYYYEKKDIKEITATVKHLYYSADGTSVNVDMEQVTTSKDTYKVKAQKSYDGKEYTIKSFSAGGKTYSKPKDEYTLYKQDGWLSIIYEYELVTK